MTVCSTREGSRYFSSLRETLLEGDTSNSEIRVEDDGEYIWRDEGWEDGRRRVDVVECTASGAVETFDVDGLSWDVAGSFRVSSERLIMKSSNKRKEIRTKFDPCANSRDFECRRAHKNVSRICETDQILLLAVSCSAYGNGFYRCS